MYVIDDMLPQPNWPEGHAAKVLNLRATLLTLAGGDPMPNAAISKLLSMKTGQGYAEFGVSSFGTDAAIGDLFDSPPAAPN